MIRDFLTDPAWVAVAACLAVILAAVASIPLVVQLGRWLGQRRQTRHLPKNTQVHKDRANYGRLLQKYEGYLTILENLIVVRSQVKRGSGPWTPELEQHFLQTRDHIFHELEKRGKREGQMGVFQLLDVLEERMVGIAEERRKRADLQARQAEIENHPLFIKRRSSGD